MSDMQICPKCNGNGYIMPKAATMVPCPMCGGTGRVPK